MAFPTPAKVLFFNVGNGLLGPERLKEALEQSQADLIGLAELTSSQAEALRQLKTQYPYQYLHGAGIPGKGILSRVPLRDAELIELYPGRPDLRAYLELSGEGAAQALQVIVAHPPPQRTHLRSEQLKALLMLATKGEPTLLMGDFNMLQSQAIYRGYRVAGLLDSFREAGVGRGFTFPTRRGRIRLRPVVRIDFIWHTMHLLTRRAWVGSDHGSDHLPIFAELTW